MVDITTPPAFIYEEPNFDCGCNEPVKVQPVVVKKCSCTNCGCSKKTDKPIDGIGNIGGMGGNNNPFDLSKDFTITLNRDFLVYAAIGIAVILIIK